MTSPIVKVVPDYLPLSSQEFVRHISNLMTTKKFKHWINYEKYTTIFGYSCRGLFEVCMKYYSSNKDLVVATTPIHHTSFRNIIEDT